jgi:acyl-CoA reductase-like NAD-dependent aldehyde dehydrogenase
MNAGQSCVAPKRIVAVGAIFDRLVEALSTAVRSARVGSPADSTAALGPLIRPAQADTVRRQCTDSIGGGAHVVAQGSLPPGAPAWAVPPTLMTNVDDRAPVWAEEVFGPVLVVRRVETVDEGIRVANATGGGLSASVWSRDRVRARSVARALECGSVAINDVVDVVGVVEVPHGGRGESGAGRIHGDEALLECTRTHTVLDDIFTGVRQPWWFPYSAAQARDFARFAGLRHGLSVRDWLQAVPAVVRLLRGYKDTTRPGPTPTT